ncbi:hypothetical protein PAXRUDRAFT_18981 [Paxillus rubicundulus Ve08.2h10]|uniref:Uncharacterized protein n=1 Tax=Paxillus rubicundulus Ve08.2h10 TaxID=930991 RepID=A0A0D0CJX8_9AGAM|nr:hypothetical protein PAXRUDRAFT_18981 [Paxillus rubicundulus Ve08.2h10]
MVYGSHDSPSPDHWWLVPAGQVGWIVVTTIMGLDEEALDHLAGIEDEEPDDEEQVFNNLM